MYNDYIYEQQDDEEQQDDQQNDQQNDGNEQQEEDILAPFEPIKRYHLISQLMKMQNNLRSINYENKILNTLIKFIDNVTYEHLLIIVPKLLKIIEQDLKQHKKNQEKQKNIA